MIIPIRVLIIEDSEDDAMLVLRGLKRGGYEPIHKRVDTPEAMKTALKSQTWDIILSDYSMPNFTGMDALLLLRETGLDIPFILMSGTVGEERAAEIMKAGAHDFIIKGHLSRLTEIVSREMRDAHNRRQQKLAEDELMASEERFRVITESANDAIIGVEEPGRIYLWNKKAEEMFGYSARETVDKELHIFIVPERYREKAIQGLKTFFKTGTGPLIGKTLELFAVRKDGTEFPVEISISAVNVRGEWEATAIIRDIAERKKAEGEKKKLIHDLGERVKELRCLHNTALILQKEAWTIPEMIREITLGLPSAWQFPEITAARIKYDTIEFTTPDFSESLWKQRADFKISHANKEGFIEVYYGREMPGEAEGPFLAEERTLIDSLAQMLESYLDRKYSEEKTQQYIEELERFKKATVQREIRMKELRDKLDKIEKSR